MDVNVNTHLKESAINGLFNEIEQLKNQRKKDMDLINLKTKKIIESLDHNQEVLVYKNDEPHLLKVEIIRSKKFDRAELANDLGVTQNKLNIPGVAELVEENKIQSEDLEDYWFQEAEPKIKVKKATKRDVQRLQQTNIYDFIE